MADASDYPHLHGLLQEYSDQLQAPGEKLLKMAVDRIVQTMAPANVKEERRGEAATALQGLLKDVLTNPEKSGQEKTVETMLAGTRWTVSSGGGMGASVVSSREVRNYDRDRTPTSVAVRGGSPSHKEKDVTRIVETLAQERYRETETVVQRMHLETEVNGRVSPYHRSPGGPPMVMAPPTVRIDPPSPGRVKGRAETRAAATGASPSGGTGTGTPPPPSTPLPFGDVHWIDLHKPDPSYSFGFSVGGGVGNELAPGDHGIYVTRIIEGSVSGQDGRLAVGDKLLAVRVIRAQTGEEHEISMECVKHEDAVNVLRRAGAMIRLLVEKQGAGGAVADGYGDGMQQQPGMRGDGMRQFQARPRRQRKQRSDGGGSLCCW